MNKFFTLLLLCIAPIFANAQCENDTIPPNVQPYYGLTTMILPSSQLVTIWAVDFILSASDNCTDSMTIIQNTRIRLFGTTDTFALNLTLNCCQAGTLQIEILASDTAGNTDTTITYIILQNNPLNVCNCGEEVYAEIYIETEGGECVGGVQGFAFLSEGSIIDTSLFSQDTVSIYQYGGWGCSYSPQYLYGNPLFNTYYFHLEKDTNWLNGVTTFDLLLMRKHILGIQPLTSPYKLIAADINRSGTITTFDIVQLRRLVLGSINSIEGNTSWVFVPEGTQFGDEISPVYGFNNSGIPPQNAPHPVIPYSTKMIGIKIGDVNGSAHADQ
ncbi:MAG: hypothetical protein KA974_05855 [Saprospiraceae bacterium]|nr:hypothetical protein [Saprospiraceae bacterium]MBP7699828.1 hypothetical protein [Saprospiraceae bacterium]